MIELYMAGPDVFLSPAELHQITEIRRRYLLNLSMDGLFPCDNDVQSIGLTPEQVAKEIYRKNLSMMDRCDGAIVNLSPFRGPGADPGTCFEVGFLKALDKPTFLWSEDPSEYAGRAADWRQIHAKGTDMKVGDTIEKYQMIEDFGQFENLMLACSLPNQVPVAKSFEEAALRAYIYFKHQIDVDRTRPGHGG